MDLKQVICLRECELLINLVSKWVNLKILGWINKSEGVPMSCYQKMGKWKGVELKCIWEIMWIEGEMWPSQPWRGRDVCVTVRIWLCAHRHGRFRLTSHTLIAPTAAPVIPCWRQVLRDLALSLRHTPHCLSAEALVLVHLPWSICICEGKVE